MLCVILCHRYTVTIEDSHIKHGQAIFPRGRMRNWDCHGELHLKFVWCSTTGCTLLLDNMSVRT